MRRPGTSLVGVVTFFLAAASLLTGLLLNLMGSWESLSVTGKRLEERAALSSQIEVCRRWVRAQLALGKAPRALPGQVTGAPESRRVFESRGADGTLAAVYDLDLPPSGPGVSGRPLPFCPRGLLVRSRRPNGPFPFLEIEAVWVTRDLLLPDGSVATVLDEHPLIWRETWF